jgi:hypothetical protein
MLYPLLLLPVIVCMAEVTALARLPCPRTIHQEMHDGVHNSH